ncbi:hypothetical protein [Dietzia lutea]|nr:hypothetical protein [Dietzia lutea]
MSDDRARITATLAAVDALEVTDRIEALVRTATSDVPQGAAAA